MADHENADSDMADHEEVQCVCRVTLVEDNLVPAEPAQISLLRVSPSMESSTGKRTHTVSRPTGYSVPPNWFTAPARAGRYITFVPPDMTPAWHSFPRFPFWKVKPWNPAHFFVQGGRDGA
jgi:hypothetical protein